MKTTIRLRDDLLKRAKKRAAEDGRTLAALIEEGLMRVLAGPSTRRRVRLPVSKASWGVLPGVDLNRSSDLEAVME